jgi:hypothetical protein
MPHNPKLAPDKKTLGTLAQLARIQCTEREAAAVLGISQALLNRHLNKNKRANEFALAWDDGQAKGHMSLRRLQWRLANKGNAALAIWLGKQWLGQKDIQVAVNASIDDINITSDKQRSEIESKLARIAEPKATQGLAEKPDAQ